MEIGTLISRYRDPGIKMIWSEEVKLQRWAIVERVVALAQAQHGIIPAEAAEQIGRIGLASATKSAADVASEEEHTGHDFVAFLIVWREALRRNRADEGARFLHHGLTSSDVIDTALAMALVASSHVLQERLGPLRGLLADLGNQHLDTLRIGRTHGQYAEPTTLGVKILEWAELLKRAERRLGDALREVSVGKLSGPVGTYAHNPPELEADVLRELDLAPAWGSSQVVARDRLAFWAYCVAAVGTACEQVALDFWLLAQSGIEEVAEGRRVGSSSMPHKRNPVTAEKIQGLAFAARNFSDMLQGRVLPLERNIHHSSLERIAIPDLLHAVCHVIDSTDSLLRNAQIDVDRMQANLLDADYAPYTSGLTLELVRMGWTRERAEDWVKRWFAVELVEPSFGEMPPSVRDAVAPGYYTRNLEHLRERFGKP